MSDLSISILPTSLSSYNDNVLNEPITYSYLFNSNSNNNSKNNNNSNNSSFTIHPNNLSTSLSYSNYLIYMIFNDIYSINEDLWLLKSCIENKQINQKLINSRPKKLINNNLNSSNNSNNNAFNGVGYNWIHKDITINSLIYEYNNILKQKNKYALYKLELYNNEKYFDKENDSKQKDSKEKEKESKEKVSKEKESKEIDKNKDNEPIKLDRNKKLISNNINYNNATWLTSKTDSIIVICLKDDNTEMMYPVYKNDILNAKNIFINKLINLDVYGNPKYIIPINDPKLKELKELNVFSSDTMIKYSNYVSQPSADDIIKSTFATSSQILNLQRHVQLDLEKERSNKFKLLEKLRVEEEIRTETYLKDKLARDIELLKQQYEQDLISEKEKIKISFQTMEDKLNAYFVSEESTVIELASSLIKDNGIVLNNIMQNSTKEEILQSESVGRLLLLAWHLQHFDLINDATTVIARNINEYSNLNWFPFLDKPIIIDSSNKTTKASLKETTLLSLILMKSSEKDIYESHIKYKLNNFVLANIFQIEFENRLKSYLKLVEGFSLSRLMDEYLSLNQTESVLKGEKSSPTNTNLPNSLHSLSNKIKYLIPQISNAALSGKLLAALEKIDNFKLSDLKFLNYDYSGPIACEARLEVLLKLMQDREPFWQSIRFPAETMPHLRIRDGNNVELLTSHKYSTLHSTVLLNSQNGGYANVCLGWDVPRTSLDKTVPGFTLCAENWVGLSGCSWQNNGIFYKNTESYVGVHYIENDVLGFGLDLDHKVIFFSKNGVPIPNFHFNNENVTNSMYEGNAKSNVDQIDVIRNLVLNITEYFNAKKHVVERYMNVSLKDDEIDDEYLEELSNNLSKSLYDSIQGNYHSKILSLLPTNHPLFLNAAEISFYQKYAIPLSCSHLSNSQGSFSLVPAICCFSSKTHTKFNVQFNWKGPFHYPLSPRFYPIKFIAPENEIKKESNFK